MGQERTPEDRADPRENLSVFKRRISTLSGICLDSWVVISPKISGKSSPWVTKLRHSSCSGGSRRVRGFRTPPPPPSPSDLTLVWDWNSYINRIVYHFLTSWFFLMKRALYFATELNSRDIRNVIVFGYPPMICSPLLAKQSFPRQRRPAFTDLETRGRLFEKWFATKTFNSPFRTKVWTPPGRKIPGSAPELGSVEVFNWKWEKLLTFNCYNARKALEYVIVKRACFRSLLGHAPFNEEVSMKR